MFIQIATTQVTQWLTSVGVGQTVQKKFTYHDVDGALLLEVNDEDLREDLGVSKVENQVCPKIQDMLTKIIIIRFIGKRNVTA